MVAIEGRGAYEFRYFADAGYVADKLGLRFAVDGANVADWINAQLGFESNQGRYDEKLCSEFVINRSPEIA